MAKLAIEMYQDACKRLLKKPRKSDKKIGIPALVTARQFRELESTESFLSAYFDSEETESRFKVDILVVDGLDEIESPNRLAVIDKLDKFSEAVGCSYILTSRKIDILNTLSEKYEKYELLPFEFSQALKMVSKLASNSNILKTMRESLAKIQAQILLVPLSLMLLVELVEEHKEIPASLTELYDRFFDMALGREDREKELRLYLTIVSRKNFLAPLLTVSFGTKTD